MIRSARVHAFLILVVLSGFLAVWLYHRGAPHDPGAGRLPGVPPAASASPTGAADGPASTHAASLPPAPALTASLRVVLREDGKPVAGVNFTIIEEASNSINVYTSGPNGACMISRMPAGQYHITLHHADYVFASAHPKLETGESQEVVIDLDRGAKIEGRITDPEGRPLPGTQAWLEASGDAKGARFSREARSNADGQYSLTSIPVGTFKLRLRHDHFRAYQKTDLAVTRPGEIFRIDATLREGRSVSGHVLTDDKKPLQGALVAGTNEETATCKSDAEGAFVLTGLGDQPVQCFASVAGYGFSSQSGIAPDSTNVVLVLTKAATISGTIESDPLPSQFSVSLAQFVPDHGVYLPFYSRVFNGNQFRFNEVPPGRYQVQIRAEGFEAPTIPDVEVSPGQPVPGLQIRLRKS